MNYNTFQIKQYIDRQREILAILEKENDLLYNIDYCIRISDTSDYNFLCHKIMELNISDINLVFYKDKESIVNKLYELRYYSEKRINEFFD